MAENTQKTERKLRRWTAAEKARIVRRHLQEKVRSAADNTGTAHTRRRAKRVDQTMLLQGVRWQELL